jgi:hypothetical protein
MPTPSFQPTYYRITWDGAAPTDYNALTGEQAGGVDNTKPEAYNRRVSLTGTQSAPTVTPGHSITINGVEVVFSGAGTLASVIDDINALQRSTGACAYSDTVATYLTIANAPGYEGSSITVAAGTSGTALADLGLPSITYQAYEIQVSDATSFPVTNGDNIKINGVTITFATGALDQTGVLATINALSMQTNVSALACGDRIQLASDNGQPFALLDGTVAGSLAKLGYSPGNFGGYPTTYALSLAKERATMRWDQIVINLGWLISPVFLGDVIKTGNFNGEAPVSTMSWTVGYDRPSYLEYPDSTSPGNVLKGVNAIKRLVAEALIVDLRGNQEIFDPTIQGYGNACARPNPLQILSITSQALDTNVATVESNISVSVIPNI